MKTILIVLALALTVSLSGNAATTQSVTKNQTENIMASKTNSSTATKSGKSKTAHSKNHHHVSGAKKTK
jgi:hypothetical protein